MTAPSIKEALVAARQFIENGVELGYIKMPDADTPDPAHKTLSKIIAAIATLSPPAGERREAIARIIDPDAGWGVQLDGYYFDLREAQDEYEDRQRRALAKVDAITRAIRGEEVTWVI